MTSSNTEEYETYYKKWVAKWSPLINLDRLDHLFPETLNECTAVEELEKWEYYTPKACAAYEKNIKNGCLTLILKIVGRGIILALLYQGLGIH